MAKHNQKGRSKGKGNFIMLRYDIYYSAAYQNLNPKAACIYLAIKRRFNGHNNGEIGLSMREAASIAKCSKSTAQKAFNELLAHGLIAMNNKGHFRNRHASTWRLTCEATEKQAPTNEWRSWQPYKT